MPEMSKEEFERMQNDAIRRVRNMQQRAQSHLPPMPDYVRPLHGIPQPRQEPDDRYEEEKSAPQQNPASHKSSQPTKRGGLGFLDKLNLKNFEMDSDRSLILMMMALLGKETADETLMLALLYIML